MKYSLGKGHRFVHWLAAPLLLSLVSCATSGSSSSPKDSGTEENSEDFGNLEGDPDETQSDASSEPGQREAGAQMAEAGPTEPPPDMKRDGAANDPANCKDGECEEDLCADVDCDDGDACTEERCVDGECVVVEETSCEDNGDVCDGEEICDPYTGECVSGGPLDCSMGEDEPCLVGSCDPEGGCELTVAEGEDCDDGEPYTIEDSCNAEGVCEGRRVDCLTAEDCPQTADNACAEVYACEDYQCVVVSPAIPSDDGDACTQGDTCDPATGAVIPGTPVDCDDGDVCTADRCAPATGCVHAAVDPNDDNDCTADTCDPDYGVLNTPTPGVSCDDGDSTTVADACDDTGMCVGVTPACTEDAECDDQNVCTANSCVDLQCTSNVLVGDPCDDGDDTTAADSCQDDASCAGVPLPTVTNLAIDCSQTRGQCWNNISCKNTCVYPTSFDVTGPVDSCTASVEVQSGTGGPGSASAATDGTGTYTPPSANVTIVKLTVTCSNAAGDASDELLIFLN